MRKHTKMIRTYMGLNDGKGKFQDLHRLYDFFWSSFTLMKFCELRTVSKNEELLILRKREGLVSIRIFEFRWSASTFLGQIWQDSSAGLDLTKKTVVIPSNLTNTNGCKLFTSLLDFCMICISLVLNDVINSKWCSLFWGLTCFTINSWSDRCA